MNVEAFTTYCGLRIDLNYHANANSPVHVIFNSGYSILGFDEPIQIALRSLFSNLGFSWIQYTFPERTLGSPVEDLYLSTGLLALLEVHRWASLKFSSRPAMFGISFGANIAIEHALANTTEFLVLVNTVFDYRRFRERQLGDEAFKDWERTGMTTIIYAQKQFPLGFRFIREADAQNLEHRAQNLKCPVYAFQGMQDPFISVDHIERIAAVNSRWNTFLIPGADHAFDKKDSIESCVDTVKAILEHSRSKEGPSSSI